MAQQYFVKRFTLRSNRKLFYMYLLLVAVPHVKCAFQCDAHVEHDTYACPQIKQDCVANKDYAVVCCGANNQCYCCRSNFRLEYAHHYCALLYHGGLAKETRTCKLRGNFTAPPIV